MTEATVRTAMPEDRPAADDVNRPTTAPTGAALEYLLALTWESGQLAERRRIAEGAADLDRCWVERERSSVTARIRARTTEMEECAAELHRRLGRPPGYEYRGGPVDFTTGRQLRRTRAAA